MSVCLFVRRLWGGCRTASQPFNHAFTSFGTITITLPTNIREKYGIKTGDTFRLIDLDGVFVLTPMAPVVPELARKIEQTRLEAGLNIDDLLHSLREQRKRYSQEKYSEVNKPGN
jgi:bifunctional DNA-binding transcriptional regulator/antitoxin component of YhaV-PrlF toxin-antitoxin module